MSEDGASLALNLPIIMHSSMENKIRINNLGQDVSYIRESYRQVE
jgi:hypothetical protein